MGAGRKFDHPPLLAPGRHYLTLMDVWQRFGAWGGRPRRRALYQKFEAFVQSYLVAGIVCEIWIDGSFLTEKPDPSDIDCAVILEPDVAENLTDEQNTLIDHTNSLADHPDIDNFVLVKKRIDDPYYLNEFLNPLLKWHEIYGLENSEKWLKGYVILRLRETNVGLRICR